MKKVILIVLTMTAWFVPGFLWGMSVGKESGAKQMARHILNPAFETLSFYDIMSEECGDADGWLRINGDILLYKEGMTIDGAILDGSDGLNDTWLWPAILTDENFEYSEEGERLVAIAIADGLMGWGNCYAGGTPPANFGKGMGKIGKITGCLTGTELLVAAERIPR